MKILQSKLAIALVLASLFQLCVLSGEYLLSVYPIWVGQKVTLAIAPVDPRSLFRGQYARLNYDIGSIKRDSVQSLPPKLRHGDAIFVSLEERSSHWIATRASFNKPSNGVFIKGRLRGNHSNRDLQVEYGIEAYFASPERAREIENDLRRANRRGRKIATADVMVAPSGRATLIGVNTKELVGHETGGVSVSRPVARNYIEIGKRTSDTEFATGVGGDENAYCIECPVEIQASPAHALRFDGESSLYIPHDWRFRTQRLTVAAWISLDETPGKESVLLAKQSPGGRSGYRLSYVTRDDETTGFEASFVDYKNRVHSVFYPFVMIPDSWHSVALSFDNGRREIVVDGQVRKNICHVKLLTGTIQSESCASQVTINYGDSLVRIGAPTHGAKGFWTGRIARLSMFSEVLSKEEVQEHLNTKKPF